MSDRKTINLKIITIDGILFAGEVSEIILPSVTGQISVLPDHIPMISTLKEGIVVIKIGNQKSQLEKRIKISAGVLEIRPDNEAFILNHDAKEV